MENIKKYASGLLLLVKVVSICLAALGFIGYLLFMLKDQSLVSSFIILVATVAYIGYLWGALFVDGWIFDMAVDKGYVNGKYAWILYFLAPVGVILVLAMPDKTPRQVLTASPVAVEE